MSKRVSLLFVASVSVVANAIAQSLSRHTITHEDVFLMKRVGAPVVSPDGKWAVFSLTEPSYDESKTVSDLWIVPTDGSTAPRRLTSTKAGESGVDGIAARLHVHSGCAVRDRAKVLRACGLAAGGRRRSPVRVCIYLGRFLRWNSWDTLTNPRQLSVEIVDRVMNPFSNPQTVGVTVVYGVGLFLGYVALRFWQPATITGNQRSEPRQR